MPKVLKFTIRGNPVQEDGNPIPYTRSTQRGQWKPSVVKYNAWKAYVCSEFYDTFGLISKKDGGSCPLEGKCLTTAISRTARMDIKIYWINDHHGDPDNIFKGIADALFENDKYLSGSFNFDDSKDKKGRVEVCITLGISTA